MLDTEVVLLFYFISDWQQSQIPKSDQIFHEM